MKDGSREQDETAGLVRAAQAGDKAAFDRLVQLYQRQAVGFALGILGNRDDAAEVVQEAFVKAYLGLAGLSQPERFRFWLLKITANEAISRRRAVRRRRIVTSLFVAARVERRSSGPQEREDADELGKAVRQAMRHLTDGEARAIALFGLDDLPQEEVGRIMDCSAGAVRWHVHRARKKMRVLLKEFLE
jgi:RNA polymerase sigma-70 factor (ECF subfamily)